MKRSVLVLAAAAMAVAAHPALAASKPAAKPVTATYYFHGSSDIGNEEVTATGAILPMDATKPTGTSDKRFFSVAAGVTPNTECAASTLLAAWSGKASGNLVGTAKVDFYAAATPAAKAVVQIFPDVTETSQCNEAYPAPLAETTIDLKAGNTALNTAMLPMPAKAKVGSSFLVQVNVIVPGPSGHFVAYDSTTSPSAVTFTCQPATGKKTC